jgi:hypothetical protein
MKLEELVEIHGIKDQRRKVWIHIRDTGSCISEGNKRPGHCSRGPQFLRSASVGHSPILDYDGRER